MDGGQLCLARFGKLSLSLSSKVGDCSYPSVSSRNFSNSRGREEQEQKRLARGTLGPCEPLRDSEQGVSFVRNRL